MNTDQNYRVGGVVIRKIDQGLYVGMVKSTDGSVWVLPKGHIEPNEVPLEAAIREVREETGVVAAGISWLTQTIFDHRTEGKIIVEWFLLHYITEVPRTGPEANRKVIWVDLALGAEITPFSDLKQLLHMVGEEVKKMQD